MKYSQALVIGVGNELRGDDGIGPYVARRIKSLNHPTVDLLIIQQLTPELAELISTVEKVVFVDACMDTRESPIVIEPLDTSAAHLLMTHVTDPSTLLRLSMILYGRVPPAWLVTIQGEYFGIKEGLSSVAQQRAIEATKCVLALLDSEFAAANHAAIQCGDTKRA